MSDIDHTRDCILPSDGKAEGLVRASELFALAAERDALRAENERLKIENIQMQAALGYGILADDERHILPSNPFKCGTCDASKHLRAENERLRAELRDIARVTRGWEPGVWSEEEGRKYFSSLFFGAQEKARAALEEKP